MVNKYSEKRGNSHRNNRPPVSIYPIHTDCSVRSESLTLCVFFSFSIAFHTSHIVKKKTPKPLKQNKRRNISANTWYRYSKYIRHDVITILNTVVIFNDNSKLIFYIIPTLYPSFFIGWSIKFFCIKVFDIFSRRQPEKEKKNHDTYKTRHRD